MLDIDISGLIRWFYGLINELSLLGSRGSLYSVWVIFYKYYGWIPFLYFVGRYMVFVEYMEHIQSKWVGTQKWTYLAIDVPKTDLENIRPVQGMEEFFIHLLGSHGNPNYIEKYIEGKVQLGFSFEIVSIEGNIQYLIRTPAPMRDLVESGIYAQFPDAEITEVEDYTKAVPQVWPNDTHDLWGAEFTLDNGNWYPIKTYKKFEDERTKVYVDPLAALLESMSKIGAGEQMWLQIAATPLGPDWNKDGKGEVEKVMGKAKKHAPGILASLGNAVAGETSYIAAAGLGMAPQLAAKAEEKAINPLLTMSPGDREKLRSLEEKLSKLAYGCKVRYIYLADKAHMNKSRGVNPITGAMKQFGILGVNGFKPDGNTATKAEYYFVNYRLALRKQKIFNGFKKRSGGIGGKKIMLNVEELASVWHFPTEFVKTPTVRTTKIKKTEAPVALPFEVQAQEPKEKKAKAPAAPAPENVVPLAIDLDDDSFESKFAKDKEAFKTDNAEHKARIAQKESVRAAAPVRTFAIPPVVEEAEKPLATIEDNAAPETIPAEEGGGLKPPTNLPF